jgi:hypothetical protein
MQQDVQHPQGGIDGGEDLVGVDATGLDLAAGVAPGDDALGQCIGAPAPGDVDLEVSQPGPGPRRPKADPGAWRSTRQRLTGSSPSGLPSGPERLP